jgi:hypothetical protein
MLKLKEHAAMSERRYWAGVLAIVIVVYSLAMLAQRQIEDCKKRGGELVGRSHCVDRSVLR